MSATDRLFFALFPPVTTAARVYALQQDLRVRHGLWGRALAIERRDGHSAALLMGAHIEKAKNNLLKRVADGERLGAVAHA